MNDAEMTAGDGEWQSWLGVKENLEQVRQVICAALKNKFGHVPEVDSGFADSAIGTFFREPKRFAVENQDSLICLLVRIASYKVIDYIRRLMLQTSWQEEKMQQQEAAALAEPDQKLLREECEAAFEAALSELDEEYRKFVKLRLKGLAWFEIAEQLDSSEDSVKKRYQRKVLSVLRKHLDAYKDELYQFRGLGIFQAADGTQQDGPSTTKLDEPR